jgi:hypothetical protein
LALDLSPREVVSVLEGVKERAAWQRVKECGFQLATGNPNKSFHHATHPLTTYCRGVVGQGFRATNGGHGDAQKWDDEKDALLAELGKLRAAANTADAREAAAAEAHGRRMAAAAAEAAAEAHRSQVGTPEETWLGNNTHCRVGVHATGDIPPAGSTLTALLLGRRWRWRCCCIDASWRRRVEQWTHQHPGACALSRVR